MAKDRDGDAVRGGERAAAHHADMPRRQPREIVQRVDLVERIAIEKAVLDHGARAGEDLLGGLEDEGDVALEVIVLGEVRSGRQQRDGMAVVAAAVELAIHRRAIVDRRLLAHRQRIELGAQSDQALAAMGRLALPAQQADDAGPADSRLDLETEGPQPLSDERRRAVLLEADLRVRMQLPQPGKGFRLVRSEPGLEHGPTRELAVAL